MQWVDRGLLAATAWGLVAVAVMVTAWWTGAIRVSIGRPDPTLSVHVTCPRGTPHDKCQRAADAATIAASRALNE